MNSKTWIFYVIGISLLITGAIISFNYFINPYGVFKHDRDDKKFVKNHTINSEITKFYYAIDADPEVLMIGTSRVEHINPKYLEKYTSGKVYNLAVKGSSIYRQYNLMNYFIEHFDIKEIYLGLDFFSFSPVYVEKSIKNTRYDNYFINDYLDSLLSVRTFRKSIKTYKDVKNKAKSQLDLFTGWDSEYKKEKLLKSNGLKWLKKNIDSSFPNFGVDKNFFDYNEFKNPKSIDKAFDTLELMMSICEKNNVKLKIFTTPLYYKVYEVINLRGYGDTYKYWKNRLKKYNQIYDFNYKNSVTSDYASYIDASHFRSFVGELIFAKMNNDKIDKLPNDFGRLLLSEEQ